MDCGDDDPDSPDPEDDSSSGDDGDSSEPDDQQGGDNPLDDWVEFQRFRAHRNNESPPSGSLMVSLADQDASHFGVEAASMANLIIEHLHPAVELSHSDAVAWTSLFQWDLINRTPTPFETGAFCCLWLTRGRDGETVSCLESLFPVDGTPANRGAHEVRFLSKIGADPQCSGPPGKLPRLLRIMGSRSGGIGRLFPEEIAAFEVNYPERIVGVKRKIDLVSKRLFKGKVPPKGYENESKELERFLPHFLKVLAEKVAGSIGNPLIVHVWSLISARGGAKASEAEVRQWLARNNNPHPDPEVLHEAMKDCGCFPLAPGLHSYEKRWPLLREAVLRHREKEFGIPRSCAPDPSPRAWLLGGRDSIGPEAHRP